MTSNLGSAGHGDYLAVTYQSRTGIPTYKKQVLERMQPVHEVQIKEGKKLSEWMSATLYAPRGSGQFNVLELHAYTDFAGIHASGITPIQTLLNRQFGLSLSEIFSPPEASKTEIRRIVQLVRPSRATPSGAGGF